MFKVAVLMFKAIHGSASKYLRRLVRVTDLPGRCFLCSARSNRLLVSSIRLSTDGGWAFQLQNMNIIISYLMCLNFSKSVSQKTSNTSPTV